MRLVSLSMKQAPGVCVEGMEGVTGRYLSQSIHEQGILWILHQSVNSARKTGFWPEFFLAAWRLISCLLPCQPMLPSRPLLTRMAQRRWHSSWNVFILVFTDIEGREGAGGGMGKGAVLVHPRKQQEERRR
jgi:hypothetical protein